MSILGEAWNGVKDFGSGIWGAVSAVVGCPTGVAGFLYTSAQMQRANPGYRQGLTNRMKEILAACYSPWFPKVNLDKVSVRYGASFPGIPGDPRGLTLGYDIYLKPSSVNECDIEEMLLVLHELVHVAQYERYGWAGFACLYGFGTMNAFSKDNSLEQQAVQFEVTNRGELECAIGHTCNPGEISGLTVADDWFWILAD